MGSTDYLRLGEHKILKELCESLPKNIGKTLNLLAVYDNVLFTWDFQNSHVLCLNIKAPRSSEGDSIIHQKLLPISPPLFGPEALVANDDGSLLAVFGPSGILVLQLPQRSPPYGAFDNNKEVVYCRSHSLDERLLACNDTVDVRQVKFYPGSYSYNHIMALTSDNMLRLYQIINNEAMNISVIPVGEKPTAMFPGSKTPFLECFGEIAVDFDFGNPEITTTSENLVSESSNRSLVIYGERNCEGKKREKYMINAETQTIEKIVPKEITEKEKRTKAQLANLVWPVYILRGDLTVYSIYIDLTKKFKPELKGPLPLSGFDGAESEACSLLCLSTVPQIVCIAMSNGTICHSILLNGEDDDDSIELNKSIEVCPSSKEILAFETVELELGLTTGENELESRYKCPIFLHKDESKPGRYYATHSTGVHSVSIDCVEELQAYVNGPGDENVELLDVFTRPSKAEYMICTKTTSSETGNTVIGFAIYYEPSSIISLLGDGSIISLGVMYTPDLPRLEDLSLDEDQQIQSPFKKMLKEPFEVYIQKILKKILTQPVLKLPLSGEHNQEQCYELLQRAGQIFRDEYFKHHTKAREELGKRIQTLTIMKKNQQTEIQRMIKEREVLQEKASMLAEKYEDIKDKQDDLLNKCENLLMLVNRKKSEPSDAEKAFMEEIKVYSERVVFFGDQMDKLRSKMKYQQVQIENYKSQEMKKISAINEQHANTIKTNLEDTTKKITQMIREINEFRKTLNLK